MVPEGPGHLATGVSPWIENTGNTQAPEGRRRSVARNGIASRCMCVPSGEFSNPPPLRGWWTFYFSFPRAYALVVLHKSLASIYATGAVTLRPKGAATCQPRATPWGSEHNNVEALKGRNSQVLESPSSLSLMNGTFGIDCLLRPFRAFWSCASRTQGDALG